MVTVTNLDATSVAAMVNNAKSIVQAALVTAGFSATVASATAAIVAIPTAIPTAGSANSDTGGKNNSIIMCE
jgi:phage-related tail fiber protein